jgi:exodeoxyribonuclease VII large subunit
MRRDNVSLLDRSMRYSSPENYIRTMRQQIDSIQSRITSRQESRLELLQERLTGRTAALKTADPRALLARGYAMITRDDGIGTRVKSVDAAPPGTRLKIQLADGEIAARVDNGATSTDEPDQPYQKPLF